MTMKKKREVSSRKRDSILATLGTKLNVAQVLSTAQSLFTGIDTPVALSCYLLVKYEEYGQLVEKSVTPSNYLEGSDYFNDQTAVSFLRKFQFPGKDDVLSDRAKKTFLECELACAESNVFFEKLSSDRVNLPTLATETAFFAARRKIALLLGDFDPKEWMTLCRFGPGKSLGIPGESPYVKLSSKPSVTGTCSLLARELIESSPAWKRSLTYGSDSELEVDIVPGGSYSQVPKDAKTFRNIEVQPLMNGFMQLGIGSMIRSRLKRVGINLNSQDANQNAARIGSINNSIATIDLSNASDTICKRLVEWLLPHDWVFAMDVCRTHYINFDNEVIPLQRYCSMGNGFAFELESLIFWALTQAIVDQIHPNFKVLVYGDDIITPSDCFTQVRTVLTAAGFSVNYRKSFFEGNFRESCGADWWKGIPVRPLFVKEVPQDVAAIISLANGIRRLANRLNRNFGCDRRCRAAWISVIQRIPSAVRKRLARTDRDDDSVIICNRVKAGKRVVFRLRLNYNLNWYPALALALYRLDQRKLPTENRLTMKDMQELASHEKTGQLSTYRRGSGRLVYRGYVDAFYVPRLDLHWL
jgi:hypothetical protein